MIHTPPKQFLNRKTIQVIQPFLKEQAPLHYQEKTNLNQSDPGFSRN